MRVHDIESILVLVLAATLLVRLADLGKIPAPIALVLGGLAIAFIPGLPDVELEPDTVFLVFLPPLVYAAAWRTSPLELRALMRPLALLSVVLVFLTAGVVALVAHALVPELSWAEAAILGAVLAPTDTIAATSIFRRLGAPERVRLLVEGESMINDGTALVIYRIAVGVATGSAFSFGGAALDFVGIAAGGIVVGLVVGVLSDLVVRRLSDNDVTIMLTVLTAYAAYIGAEELHVSGILAAVVAGVYAGYRSPFSLDADIRLNAVAFWQVLVFGLEITLFILLGLQLPDIVDTLETGSSGISELLLPVAAIAAASIAVRLAFVFALRGDAGDTLGERFAVGWSGMRGAVSLAAALAVPLSVDGRPQIIFLTFALILVTIVGQGLSLPFIVRALDLEHPLLVRRRGGGADGGGAIGARPPRRDGEGRPRQRVTAEAIARPLPGPLPNVPSSARRRGSRGRHPRAEDRRLRPPPTRADRNRARGTADPEKRRPPPPPDAADDRARPRPRRGPDPSVSGRGCQQGVPGSTSAG